MKIINRKRFVLLVLLAVIFLVVFCLAGAYIFIRYQINTPLNQQSDEKVFVIKKGEGLEKIAANLEEAHLIRNRFWFVNYVFYKGWAAHLQAGEYLLSPSLNISQIAERIAKGEVIPQEVKATIPEGFTLKQIDNRLTQAGLIEAGELINADQDDLSVRFQVPSLEGYLFPDTYEFKKRMSLEEIINIMIDNFNQKLDGDLRKEITRQGKTIQEIVIMASLLEKEVPTYQDRQIVSGIFWKRLVDKYPLQSCATIAYILSVDKWQYSIEDTKVNSPYNTYQNLGLPSGPICNPGLLAIKAAIYPQESDYNFFLSKPDGETVFSKTLEEHNQNKAKYLP